jgi:hypothetical protein
LVEGIDIETPAPKYKVILSKVRALPGAGVAMPACQTEPSFIYIQDQTTEDALVAVIQHISG